jgi:hypothetical protein
MHSRGDGATSHAGHTDRGLYIGRFGQAVPSIAVGRAKFTDQ